jgi:membrane protein implicated in regulation of membrane protease activity
VTAWRRYLLFQIPGWALAAALLIALHYWFDLSTRTAVVVYAAYVVKDFLLYPFLRRSYEVEHRTQIEHHIGHEAKVTEPLNPTGFVRVRGELWRARIRDGNGPLEAGTTVRIAGVEGWTLLVDGKEASRGGLDRSVPKGPSSRPARHRFHRDLRAR